MTICYSTCLALQVSLQTGGDIGGELGLALQLLPKVLGQACELAQAQHYAGTWHVSDVSPPMEGQKRAQVGGGKVNVADDHDAVGALSHGVVAEEGTSWAVRGHAKHAAGRRWEGQSQQG